MKARYVNKHFFTIMLFVTIAVIFAGSSNPEKSTKNIRKEEPMTTQNVTTSDKNSATDSKSKQDTRTIDHRHTKLERIPESAIKAAKEKLHIAYGHTSHGSQIRSGMNGLAQWKGDLYKVPNWKNKGDQDVLDLRSRVFEGANDLGNPNRTAWAEATRAYLKEHPEVNVVMWSWCGQAGYATKEEIATHLSLMRDLERDYPEVAFVYMTGHLDGTGLSGNLYKRNEQIREHCKNNNSWLYDFADIESYDPDGVFYADKGANDQCYYDSDGDGEIDRNWAIDWEYSHKLFTDWYPCGAAHSQPLNGNLKAYAAWYLFARIAGWSE